MTSYDIENFGFHCSISSIIISEAVIIADYYYDDLLSIEEKMGKNMLLMLPAKDRFDDNYFFVRSMVICRPSYGISV
jgi:hypothetical protein